MSSRRSLVLVQNRLTHDALRALASGLPWPEPRGLALEAFDGDVQSAVARHRAAEGATPIGVVAQSEHDALAAIAGGADEAAVLASLDAATLVAFVDRVELRARLRADGARMQQTFAQAERLTALGTLVAGIGHEINNPVAAMLLSIEAVRRYVLPACDGALEIARALRSGAPVPRDTLEKLAVLEAAQGRGRDVVRIMDDIGAAADSIAAIVRDLRVFARGDEDVLPELVEIEDIVDQALRLVGHELFQHALVERDFAPGLPPLLVPRNRVAQVVVNLLINAAHAIREVERPDHRVRISTRADDEFVALVVSDTGPGIPTESLERIFDPFFTTKRMELGTGLGLAISRATLRELGGDLSVESVYREGAAFICFLPIPEPEAVRTAHRPKVVQLRRPASPSTTRHSVLVVDDDERVLRSYMRLLHPLHRLLIAQDSQDAIELLESGSAPDAVLLELDLPGADGRELLSWLERHKPALHRRALVVTSAASDASFESFLRTYKGPVLHKPVRGDELLAGIARVLG